MKHPQVPIEIYVCDKRVQKPLYGSLLASGFDLQAILGVSDNLKLKPGETSLISTGLKFNIPPGYELQIRSRSGLALKHGIVVLNAPGTIDADYRGEVKVILKNTHPTDVFEITTGMKIAQAVLCPVVQAIFSVVRDEEDLGVTERGEGGFGSTGI